MPVTPICLAVSSVRVVAGHLHSAVNQSVPSIHLAEGPMPVISIGSSLAATLDPDEIRSLPDTSQKVAPFRQGIRPGAVVLEVLAQSLPNQLGPCPALSVAPSLHRREHFVGQRNAHSRHR
jgi:hypothetical protein